MMALALFLSAFVSATLFPMSSELVLISAVLNAPDQAVFYVVVATLGNSLGSCVNWMLGQWFISFQDRSWFPVSRQNLAKAQERFSRWGYWSLLLAWVPIIGDPLTVVAGLMRMPLRYFLPVIILAKGGRYALLVTVMPGV